MAETSDDRPRLLLVDDTPANLALLNDLLRERYQLRIGTSGAKALELARSNPPDLILLDVVMPGMGGPEVLQQIRSDPRLRHIPVVMVSAVDEMDTVIRCIELGADDYLTKPFNPTLLTARIRSSLERKRLHDEVRQQAQQLAEWNEKLESRVQDQLRELERLARLKRFFAPQVAATIVAGNGEELLRTHRREVVVVFLDMRGFTQFTERAEPEEVMQVLSAYHGALGSLIGANEGTLEHFEGDGMMIFFNDPIPLPNPAENAIRMAVAMRERFLPLRNGWARRGYDLGLGIGIAQGYATLGAVGFEDRWEYACIGAVTNRAARICGQATHGQILVDRKAYASIEDLVDAEPVGEMNFKGIAYPVFVHDVRGLRS